MRIRVSPTPSNTPSHTPTITPSLTSCPTFVWDTTIKLLSCDDITPLELSGWTLQYSGVSYTAVTQYSEVHAGTWCNVGPVLEPYVGAIYSFNLTSIPNGWELCPYQPYDNALWDRFDVVLTSYNGFYCYTTTECYTQYTCEIKYYYSGEVQHTAYEVVDFLEYQVSENPACPPSYLMFNQQMYFQVRQIPLTPTPTTTSTPTNTPSITPSPTYCANPTAYSIFDSNADRTNLSNWMISKGSTFRGFNSIGSPSTVQAIFQSQMNAYIDYTGYTVGNNNALMSEPVSLNEDPITILNTNLWSDNNTWVSIIVPNCPLCPEGLYTYINNGIDRTPSNDYRSLTFYYSGNVIPQGYYNFYTTFPGTGMRKSSSDTSYDVNTLVCPVTPTPTTTATQTQTATPTRTPTMTPSATSSGATLYCYVGIWEVDDPLHPSGGTVNYIDQLGNPQTITGVWLDQYIQFNALSITFITGLVTTPCLSPTPSATPTLTPTPSGICPYTIYTHGAILATCSDFCNTNYLIHTTDCASEPYGTLSIGDFIYGYSGQAGYLAYSNVYTDTNTGPFRIADIDGTGEILGLYVCVGGSCIPL